MDLIGVPQQVDVEALLVSYQLSPDVEQLNKYFNEKSIIEILHVERKENYHSNFLKWFFEDRDLYDKSLRLLLLLLLKRNRQLRKSHFPAVIRKALLTNSFYIDNVRAELEDSIINNEGKGRCDIRLVITYHFPDGQTKKLYVLVENKVFSEEHKAGNTDIFQTQFYFDHYCKEYGKDNCIFVFLNLIDPLELNNLTESKCKCKDFIQINYQDLLDNVLAEVVSYPDIKPRNQFIIKEYIKGLSIQKNNGIMAMEKTLSDLLVSFWENNNELIKLSLEALEVSPNIDEEYRDQVKVVNEQIRSLASKKDTTHYRFNSQVHNGKSVLFYSILDFFLAKKSSQTITKEWMEFIKTCKGTLDDFSDNLKWTINKHYDGTDVQGSNKALKKEVRSLTKPLIYTEGEFLSVNTPTMVHNYSRQTLHGNTYFCYNQWGWGNIDYAIKFFREREDNQGLEIELI